MVKDIPFYMVFEVVSVVCSALRQLRVLDLGNTNFLIRQNICKKLQPIVDFHIHLRFSVFEVLHLNFVRSLRLLLDKGEPAVKHTHRRHQIDLNFMNEFIRYFRNKSQNIFMSLKSYKKLTNFVRTL